MFERIPCKNHPKVINSDGVSRLGHGLETRVSRPISVSFGLEGFRSRLSVEGYRSRDFECCKEMV